MQQRRRPVEVDTNTHNDLEVGLFRKGNVTVRPRGYNKSKGNNHGRIDAQLRKRNNTSNIATGKASSTDAVSATTAATTVLAPAFSIVATTTHRRYNAATTNNDQDVNQSIIKGIAAATTMFAPRITANLRKSDMRPVATEAASPTKVAVADVAATETSKTQTTT